MKIIVLLGDTELVEALPGVFIHDDHSRKHHRDLELLAELLGIPKSRIQTEKRWTPTQT